MTNRQSLATRALLAIFLTVGFYLLALGLVAVLLWIPYADYAYLHRVHVRIAAVCLGAAGTVLWALVPRVDRFEPPGPEIDPQVAPGLFAIVRQVAQATGQREPKDIYLLHEVNAWVTHRGGVMGFGSHRVMGVGLPLLNGLTREELTAVVAHEFGHYSGGDVSLGPWIYKTRSAIGRTLAGVKSTLLESVFNGYARLFMRLTMMVSRHQEFVADGVSARIAGTAAASRTLTKVASLESAHRAYVHNELIPVVRAGFLPPIAAGFDQFLGQAAMNGFMETIATSPAVGEPAGEFDSHPSLAERIEALKAMPPIASTSVVDDDFPILDQPEMWASTLFARAIGQEQAKALRAIDWQQVGEEVYAAQWRRMAQEYSVWFGSTTVAALPAGRGNYIAWGSRLVGKNEININGEERAARARSLFVAGVGASLSRLGWRTETSPGGPIELVSPAGLRLNPGECVNALDDGSLQPAEWQDRCDALGISGVALRPVA